MDATPTRPINLQRLLNEEAAAWLLELEEDSSTDTETRFRQWLESSADHMQAFLEITAIDRDLDNMDPEGRIDLDSLLAAVRAEGAPNIVTLPTRAMSAVPQRSHARIAAAVIGLGVLAWLAVWAWHTNSGRYNTALGEQRAVKLDDGSLIHLNTLTRIEVNFSGEAREVRLLEGEALFTVERDSERPFRVVSGSTVVQAMGTQFNVYRRSGATTVSVVEGRVQVTDAAAPVMLDAGEAANVESDGNVAKHSANDVAKAISWRQRQLSFDHETLGHVATEFNRYNRLQIRIADPRLRERELEGVFNADEPQALLDFLALEQDLRFERQGDVVNIYLKPR
jgi:transmembrane sensor